MKALKEESIYSIAKNFIPGKAELTALIGKEKRFETLQYAYGDGKYVHATNKRFAIRILWESPEPYYYDYASKTILKEPANRDPFPEKINTIYPNKENALVSFELSKENVGNWLEPHGKADLLKNKIVKFHFEQSQIETLDKSQGEEVTHVLPIQSLSCELKVFCDVTYFQKTMKVLQKVYKDTKADDVLVKVYIFGDKEAVLFEFQNICEVAIMPTVHH